ncbi:MAG: BRCT domain-containing protein, partial [Sphaerochaeta sp.]
ASKEDIDTLVSIKQIGPKSAQLLIDGLNDPAMLRRIEALRNVGLQFEEKSKGENTLLQVFADQVWCVTGSFEHFNPRSLAMEEVQKRGGRTVSSITGKTTHLLAGSGAGSKLDQATKLGVQVVRETEFMDLLLEEKPREDKQEMQGEFSF